jgi:hypothetical protein
MEDVLSVMGEDFFWRHFIAPKLTLYSLSFNKLVINISDTVNNNKDDVCENPKLLACACDIDGNSFEVQQQGKSSPQVKFYDAWQHKGKCRKCLKTKERFNVQHFGKRWVIVNRDMTGMCVFVDDIESVFTTRREFNISRPFCDHIKDMKFFRISRMLGSRQMRLYYIARVKHLKWMLMIRIYILT